jgi:hypothetical protein
MALEQIAFSFWVNECNAPDFVNYASACALITSALQR